MLQRRPLPKKKYRDEDIKTNNNNNDKLYKKVESEVYFEEDLVETSWQAVKRFQQTQMEVSNILKPSGPDPFPTREARKLPKHYKLHNYSDINYDFDLPFDWQVFESSQYTESQEQVTVESYNQHYVDNKVLHIQDMNKTGSTLPNISPKRPWRQVLLEQDDYCSVERTLFQNYMLNQHESSLISSDQSYATSGTLTSCIPPNNSKIDEEIIDAVSKLMENLHVGTNDIELSYEELASICTKDLDVILRKQSGSDETEADDVIVVDPSSISCRNVMSEDKTSLNIKAYFIGELPTDIIPKYYKTLRMANLSFNEFTSIPEEIVGAEMLLSLNMRNNPISSLADNIQSMTQLKFLNLSFCILSSLNKSIYNLPNLEVLDVSHNAITEIDKEIGKLKCLKELKLDGNFIAVFPHTMLRLHLLTLHCNLNYTHKLFWKVTAPKQTLSLRELSKKVVFDNNLIEYAEGFKEELQMSNYSKCDFCCAPKPYKGIKVIKPVMMIFGIRNFPMLFYVCTQTCRTKLLSATKIPLYSKNI